MQQVLLSLLLCASASAFLFGGGGGGGGGCCPPPPQASCGGGCGGCGRKKREAANIISNEDISKCNSEELRILLNQNVQKDVTTSLAALAEKLKEHHDYTVVCSEKKPQFVAETDEYCQVAAEDVYCVIFRTEVKVKKIIEGKKAVEHRAAAKAETRAEIAAAEDKKEVEKPEIKRE